MKTLTRHALALALAVAPALAITFGASLPSLAENTKAAKPAAGAKGAKDAKDAKAAPDKAAAAAPAKFASYEEARAATTAAGDLANLVEPLFATCTQKDDLAKRQCELVRSWHLERLKTRTWSAIADNISWQAQPYDSTMKTVTVSLNGCLACTHPPVVDGAPRIVATRAPQGMDEGVPIGIDVGQKDLTFDNAEKATLWATKVRPRLRVEFLFGVGQPFEGKTGKGVAINLVGRRFYNMCTGEVIDSDPPSKEPIKITNRDPSCPAVGARTDEQLVQDAKEAKLPDTLTRKDVQDAMAPVQARVYECGEVFELKQGVARVHVTLADGGASQKMTIGKPYDEGDIYLCLKEALKDAKFPRFKSASPPVEVDYPFVLRR